MTRVDALQKFKCCPVKKGRVGRASCLYNEDGRHDGKPQQSSRQAR